ncbi:hypothetical protein LTS07_011355 [Exophiala sideris]|uniref:Transcription factor domain-containing protein n=1 Tax=Exophiala sideris TaxID=1016849 RepID=A0ABR0IUX3_9EURO|nr:hypothetical protein LTS07_011355 [Exophiala sideris]KAK5022982.1 hypothetical protein LTR13_011367 [Exophiala sideris]KAK5048467.1 hypothetical protein LTR69_011335 [Exophiala sideris]KAK5176039.1 hypothetical protein LTR44_011398 [Eurotiomycetes sp. CCFEE 6388]
MGETVLRHVDSMFGVNARPITPEFIAATDARKLLLLTEVPERLRWSSDTVKNLEYPQHPHYMVRQSIVLHLRVNHLRLLLRRSDLLDAKHGSKTATLCVDIAASSIDAMYNYHYSPLKENTERFLTASCLSGTILAVTAAATQAMLKGQTSTNPPHTSHSGRIDLGPIRHDRLPSYPHALFDLELENLLQFETMPMSEDDQAMFLLSSANGTMGSSPSMSPSMAANASHARSHMEFQ